MLEPNQATLMAPLGGRKPGHFYQALRKLNQIRAENEKSRLTYVAYTRARHQLYQVTLDEA